MSNFWHWFVVIVVMLHLVAYLWLLYATSKKKAETTESGQENDATTGHVWDGDLTEYNNPLPRWWLWLFVGTILFSLGYLYAYPGLGNYEGSLNWSQKSQFNQQHDALTEARNASYAEFIDKPLEQMIVDEKAMLIGRRIYSANCAQCHGSDAQGGTGFPNLADNDWNYGGEYADILTTLNNGRNGVMPAFAPALQEEGVKQVAAYVRSFTDSSQDPVLVAEGKTKFSMFCVACHGPDAKGNQLLGAPNLTDDIWLHGSSDIIETGLYEGFANQMPSHKEILDENSIKIVAAYVYSLSNLTE